jgi:hypothetical protein
MGRISHHIRSNVYGLVAIFIALGGTAYAIDGPLAGQNTVGSSDIINGEVFGADIRANQVASSDVRDDSLANGGLTAADLQAGSVGTSEVDGSLTGDDVADGALDTADINESTLFNDNSLTGTDVASDSLTGTDITSLTGADIVDGQITGSDVNESSLGTVPQADTIDGVSARSFEYRGSTSGGTTTVMNMGGLALKADCDAFNGNAKIELFADSAVDGSTLYAIDEPLGDPGNNLTRVSPFDAADANEQLIFVDASPPLEVGKVGVYFRGGPSTGVDTASDDVVTVELAYEAGGSCGLWGTALGGAD